MNNRLKCWHPVVSKIPHQHENSIGNIKLPKQWQQCLSVHKAFDGYGMIMVSVRAQYYLILKICSYCIAMDTSPWQPQQIFKVTKV